MEADVLGLVGHVTNTYILIAMASCILAAIAGKRSRTVAFHNGFLVIPNIHIVPHVESNKCPYSPCQAIEKHLLPQSTCATMTIHNRSVETVGRLHHPKRHLPQPSDLRQTEFYMEPPICTTTAKLL